MWASAHRRMQEYEDANPGCTDAEKVTAVQQEEIDIFDEVLQARKGSEVRGLGRIGKRNRSSGSSSVGGSASGSQGTSRRQTSSGETAQLEAALAEIKSQQAEIVSQKGEIHRLKKEMKSYKKNQAKLMAAAGIEPENSDEEEDVELPHSGSPTIGTSSGGMMFMPTPGRSQHLSDDDDDEDE